MYLPFTLATLRDALTYAFLLSLMASGITLLYRTTKVPNFAHASFVTIGAYTTFSLVSLLNLNPYTGLLVSFPVSGLAALACFYLVLEPLRKRGASIRSLMIATLGVEILYFGILNIYADYLQRVFKLPSRNFSLSGIDIFILGLPGVFVVSLITTLATIIALYLVLDRTKIGIKLRASMENQALAEVMGINTRHMLALSWLIAGGLAGVSGSLMSLWTIVNPATGMTLIASMFCASILGGLNSIFGAFLGALLLTIAEVLGITSLEKVLGSWILPFRPVVPLVILSIVLLVLPGGITSIRLKSMARFKIIKGRLG